MDDAKYSHPQIWKDNYWCLLTMAKKLVY